MFVFKLVVLLVPFSGAISVGFRLLSSDDLSKISIILVYGRKLVSEGI